MKMQADAVSYGALGRWEAQRSKLEYAPGHDLIICVLHVRVGPRGTEPNLRNCRKKSQIQHAVATAVARTSGRSDRPASDPEMDTLEVTGYTSLF